MPKHLLICSCGEELVVDARQAGETVECKCGKTVDVPRLGDLRQLPVVSDRQSQSPPWTLQQGLTFAAGSLVVLVGIICLVVFFQEWVRLDTTDRRQELLAAGNQIVDKLSYTQALQAWRQRRAAGIGPKQTPDYVVAQRRAATLSLRMMIAGGGIAAGAGIAVLSLFLGRRPARRPKQAKPRENAKE